MTSLMIRFPDEARMFEWVESMVHAQALPARAQIRREDALDQPTARYVLDGGRDGGKNVTLKVTTTETVEIMELRTKGVE